MPRITKPRAGEPIRLTVTSRGEPRYQVALTTSRRGAAQRTQARRNFRTLAEARAFVDETRTAVRRGAFVVSSGVTVSEMCDRWLASRESDVLTGDLRRVTLDGYTTWLIPVRRFLGDRKVTDLRHSDIETFKSWVLREGNGRNGGPLGAYAVADALGVLQRVLGLAVLDGIISANPAAEIRRPSRKSEGADYWTPAQMSAFRVAADDDPLALALRLVLTGMRRSEVLGLAWDAVDTDGGTIDVRRGRVALTHGQTMLSDPKSRASRRTVPVEVLVQGTTALLAAERERQASDPLLGLAYVREGLVVVDAAGQPLRPEVLSDRFRQVAQRAGLPPIRMHAIRHSLATDLAADPVVADVDAAQLLGHDVAMFHRVYAQRTSDGALRAAEAVGARLRLAE